MTTTLNLVSPHKVYGPEQNDLVLQLRNQRVDQVIRAGMLANLCVESHLRELLEQGVEVAVVKDVTAAAQIPDGDGDLEALITVRSPDEAVERLRREAWNPHIPTPWAHTGIRDSVNRRHRGLINGRCNTLLE